MTHLEEASTPGRRIRVYVRLLNEGTLCFRPTTGLVAAPGVVRLDATPDYDSVDEEWEFTPGTLVTLTVRNDETGPFLIAVAEWRAS
ncbi:MAG: hypothetical protein U1F29_05300 [Planctomycetota bacterium]